MTVEPPHKLIIVMKIAKAYSIVFSAAYSVLTPEVTSYTLRNTAYFGTILKIVLKTFIVYGNKNKKT